MDAVQAGKGGRDADLRVFAGATVVCVHDARSLPPEFIDVSVRRHGLSVDEGGVRRNERFEYEPA